MSDVEYIVNKNADIRRSAMFRIGMKRRERRLKKLLMCTIGSALVAISTIFFAVIGAVHAFLATVVSIVSLMFACFVFGLYVEARKTGGRR